MKRKEKIGAVIAAVTFFALLIIASTLDASDELSTKNYEPVTRCNAYTRICFAR